MLQILVKVKLQLNIHCVIDLNLRFTRVSRVVVVGIKAVALGHVCLVSMIGTRGSRKPA